MRVSRLRGLFPRHSLALGLAGAEIDGLQLCVGGSYPRTVGGQRRARDRCRALPAQPIRGVPDRMVQPGCAELVPVSAKVNRLVVALQNGVQLGDRNGRA